MSLKEVKERIDQLAYRCDRMPYADVELELERISDAIKALEPAAWLVEWDWGSHVFTTKPESKPGQERCLAVTPLVRAE